MKLRITWILLGVLILIALMVPAFAAVADRVEDSDAESGPVYDPVIEHEVDEVITTEDTVVDVTEPAEEVEEEIVVIEPPESNSPFYLEGEQMIDLLYQNFDGVNYVTVESFLSAVDPEAIVEDDGAIVTASAETVSAIIDVIAEDTQVDMANVEVETLNLIAKVGDCYVMANNRYLYVETQVRTIENKIAVPVRTLAKVFNMNVDYDSATRRVILTRQNGDSAYLLDGDSYYDEQILYWLSRIIFSESGNQSMKGQLAVGNVVMNRLASPMFPNTIKGVLFQKNQFSPAMSGSIHRTPGPVSVIAAKLVLDGAVVLEDALFFNRAGMNTFAARNRTYVETIGAHSFYS